MNMATIAAALSAAKAADWPGFESVAATITDMVADMVECFGFGSHGQREAPELVPMTELIRVLEGQVERSEIIAALDRLAAAGRIVLSWSDDGVCALPRDRPRWGSNPAGELGRAFEP